MPLNNQIEEPWYRNLYSEFGEEFVLRAGYFEESRPFEICYSQALGLHRLRAPHEATTIIHFAGAFWPFHDGHLSILRTAIDFLDGPIWIVLHVDHAEYRWSKGSYDEEKFRAALELLKTLDIEGRVSTTLIKEDEMPNGCSRNFIRLYTELCEANPMAHVWFLAGGDRAEFALTFIREGRCLIVGRDDRPEYGAHSSYANERIRFLPGCDATTSRSIRRKHD